jgi:pilus assembly protein CpaB
MANEKPERRLFIIAVTAGLIAAALGYFYISGMEQSVMSKMEPVKVLVAADYIPAYTEIQKDNVEYKEVPKNLVTSAHVLDFQKAKNKITLVPFIKGEPIMMNKISESAEKLNTAIPTGMRAVSLAVDEQSSVDYMVKAGDYVDVVLTFEINENKKVYTVTATILQAVRVIATGNDFSGNASKDQSYSAVTLALTPEETELLIFAREKGRISLALRPVGDTAKEKIKLASINELISQIKANEKGDEEKLKQEINSDIMLKKREE